MEGMAVDLFHGNMDDLSAAINSFFHSVSSHLQPLCDSVIQEQMDIPHKYIITEQKVAEKLMSTKLSKAMGPDGLPNWVLRELAGFMCKPICAIFNSPLVPYLLCGKVQMWCLSQKYTHLKKWRVTFDPYH